MTHHEITDELARDLKERVEPAFNDRDIQAIEGLLGDHLVDHNVLLAGVDLRQRMARALEAFPDAEFSIDQYTFQGNAAAWRWSIRGPTPRRSWGWSPQGKRSRSRDSAPRS
jgi:predicted ester cyclase